LPPPASSRSRRRRRPTTYQVVVGCACSPCSASAASKRLPIQPSPASRMTLLTSTTRLLLCAKPAMLTIAPAGTQAPAQAGAGRVRERAAARIASPTMIARPPTVKMSELPVAWSYPSESAIICARFADGAPIRLLRRQPSGRGVISIVIADDQLMDVRTPNLDGIEATRRLVASGGRARVLVLTTFDLDDT